MNRRSFLKALGLVTSAVFLPWVPKQEPVKMIVWDSLSAQVGSPGQILMVDGTGFMAWEDPKQTLTELMKDMNDFTANIQGQMLPLEVWDKT